MEVIDQLNSLSKYILKEDTLHKCVLELKQHVIKEKYIKPKKEEIKDELFWCVYTIIYTDNEQQKHNLLSNKYKLEKDLKISLIENIKNSYKGTHIKKDEIENNLLNEAKITYKTLHIICIYYHIRIAIYNHDIVLYLGKDGPLYYITDYKITDKIDLSSKYGIDTIYKPIKAISAYKLAELVEMGKLLKIETKLKKNLYDDIVKKIITFIDYNK